MRLSTGTCLWMQESNGTVLSTNWKDIGKKKTDCTPPSGMEAKRYDPSNPLMLPPPPTPPPFHPPHPLEPVLPASMNDMNDIVDSSCGKLRLCGGVTCGTTTCVCFGKTRPVLHIPSSSCWKAFYLLSLVTCVCHTSLLHCSLFLCLLCRYGQD